MTSSSEIKFHLDVEWVCFSPFSDEISSCQLADRTFR